MYTIIDIETTGGSPVSEKITEIAVYKYDGEKITDEYCTLINPERKIPYYITSLTGISNAMVADAPKFYEIAKNIVELTENCIFVAHNVSFDYQFIRNEFKRLGYNYEREKLCTVQLSRRLIPGLSSYSLGNICASLGIQIMGRHRASGDAYATLKLFGHLLDLSRQKERPLTDVYEPDRQYLHPKLDYSKIRSLPEDVGNYYFFNEKAELIYIGKSRNIKARILSHLHNYSSKKSIEMLNALADIDFELTGSELIALLKESDEIKKIRPLFNRAQRRALSIYGLYSYYDQDGYIRLVLEKNDKRQDLPLKSFSSQKSGKGFLNGCIEKYELCQKLCGLYPTSGSCFAYEIASCKGACIGKEPPEEYNKRVQNLIDSYTYDQKSFYIVENGRSEEEMAVVKIKNGKYIGYGYTDCSLLSENPGQLTDCIHAYEDNRDIQQIIRTYMQSNQRLQIIPFHSELA
jgi:DNA polymerase III subunit epsilon